MGRPRHTSVAEQNVWMEQRIVELEAEDEWKQKQIVSQRKRIAELESSNQRLREALLNLNAAIDYHWNSFTGVQRMPDAHAKMIVAAQQVAKQALEAIRKEIEK